MVVDQELDMPPDVFPRMQYIKDKHMKWVKKMKGNYNSLPVSANYSYYSIYFREHAAC